MWSHTPNKTAALRLLATLGLAGSMVADSSVTSALTASAQRWAASLARSNTLAHNPNLATSVTGWRYLGENLGVGYGIGDLKHAFWQSAGHRATMLDTDVTQVGVAVVYVGGKVWVAEEFGRPQTGSTIRAVLGGYLTRPRTQILT